MRLFTFDIALVFPPPNPLPTIFPLTASGAPPAMTYSNKFAVSVKAMRVSNGASVGFLLEPVMG